MKKGYKVVKDLVFNSEVAQFLQKVSIGCSACFKFNSNKLCAIIMSLVVLLFSVSAFANVSDIVCVGPDTAGEAASEAGNNPCNLQASIADREVPVEQHLSTLKVGVDTSSSKSEAGSDSGSVQ